MNIWLLHPFAGGPGLGRHWRPFWLADAWTRMGHRPVVVSAGFHHLHRKPQPSGPQHIGNVDFWFLETTYYDAGGLGRLLNNLSFGPRFRQSAPEISKQFGKPDLIIASTPHLFFISAAHRVAQRYNANFWLEVRDLWPESIVALGMTSKWNPLVKVLGWKERSAYRAADRVVCLLAGAEDYMRSRGLPAGKFVWVPNGVSQDEIQSALTIQSASHPLVGHIRLMKQKGRRVVLYAGGMGPPNAMEVIVDAAGLLSRTNPEIYFILIGSGASRPQLEERAAKQPNVEFQDEVDRSIVHGMLHASDCAVVSFHKNALYHHGISPNKLFDYCLFAPRSVIACEQEALVGLEGLVTLRCKPGDPAALAESLILALQAPERGLTERSSIVGRFSYSRLAELYLSENRPRVGKPSPRAKRPQQAGKTVLVTQHYAPFPSPTSLYMTEIAKALAQNGRTLVITSSPNSASKLPPKPGEPEVIEIRSWWPQKSALISRSVAAVLFSIQVFIAVMKHTRREDVLLCVTNPFTLPYTVALAARLRKAASAVIIHDLYPDSLVMAGFLSASSVLTKFLRSANAVMFHWLDAVVVIGRDMSSKLLEYPRMTAAKINFIPNWATLSVRYRELDPENPYRRRCGGRFVVAMSGNAGFTHDPESVFEAARILQNNADIKFLFSGEGVGWTRLNEMQAASPLPNVTLIERVPEAELESFLSAGDIWIVPYRKNNTGVSVPSRIYNQLAVGRPIIICSEPDAEAAMLMREEEIGWVVPPEDPEAIAQVISLAASATANTTEKGHRAAIVASRFTPQISLNAYRDLMDALLDRQISRIIGISKSSA